MVFEVRRIRPDEWRELKALRLEALRVAPEAFGATYADEAAFSDARWQARAEIGAQSAESAFYVATDPGGSLVGMTAVFSRPGPPVQGVIYSVYVAEAARGGGVAARLSQAIVEFARTGAIEELLLDVRDDNVRARKFYEREGFVYTGNGRPYPHDPTFQLLEMRYEALR